MYIYMYVYATSVYKLSHVCESFRIDTTAYFYFEYFESNTYNCIYYFVVLNMKMHIIKYESS